VGKVHWGVKMTKWSVGEFDPCDPSCGVIIDSGTSFIALSPRAVKAMDGLPDRISQDCSNIEDLPDLTFELGGKKFTLPPAAYVIEVEFGNARQVSLLLQSTQRKLASLQSQGLRRACVAAFQETDHMTQFGPMMILGMPFLRHFYTIFDRGAKTIFTAPSSETCEPLKGESFLLKKKRTSLDVQPTPVDLKHAQIESGLIRPGLPQWFEL